uniref:Uncharacterized protein n=1 Tax=Arundo donax TaxID=35708 RepID=A0A0A9A334_ARUDO
MGPNVLSATRTLDCDGRAARSN